MLPASLRLPPSRLKMRSFTLFSSAELEVTIHLSPPSRLQLHFYHPDPDKSETAAPVAPLKMRKWGYVPIRITDRAGCKVPELLGLFISPTSRRQGGGAALLMEFYTAFCVHFVNGWRQEAGVSADEQRLSEHDLSEHAGEGPLLLKTCEIRKALVARVLTKSGWSQHAGGGGRVVRIVPLPDEPEDPTEPPLLLATDNLRSFSHKTMKHQNIELVAYSPANHGELPETYIDCVYERSFAAIEADYASWEAKRRLGSDVGRMGWELCR